MDSIDSSLCAAHNDCLDESFSAADIEFMHQALALAEQAAKAGEVPVGAIIVDQNGQIIGQGANAPISSCDPTAHAEIIALRQAAQYSQNYRLPNTTLYCTLEPCSMCYGAMVHARIAKLVYGTLEPKAGVVCSHPQQRQSGVFNHDIEVVKGVCERESSELLKTFFKNRRG